MTVHETPYAEGMGDRSDLSIPGDQLAVVHRLRERVDRLVLIVLSGRPLVLGEAERLADAIVAAWLPGSEGAGVADPLVGAVPYTGTLAYRWPESQQQIPLHPFAPNFDRSDDSAALWPIGHRITTDPGTSRKGSR